MNIQQLIDTGVLQLGENAAMNPRVLSANRFAIGVANKDYPAQTPRLWNSVYEQFGFTERNIRFFANPADIETVVAALRADPGYIGGDIGVGFKDKIPAFLDEVDGLAAVSQSVNIVVKRDGKLIGYNTDGVGYATSLLSLMKQRGDDLNTARPLDRIRVLLLGAGGTTSAIAAALTSLGANLIILNRTPEKAKNLAQRLNDYYKRQSVLSGSRSLIAEWAADAKVIIAAIDEPDSPLYQYSALGEILLPASQENIAHNLADARAIMRNLLPTTIISDVMLRTDDTATVREAKLAGFLTLDGFPMVLNQGIEAFWLVNESVLRTKPISKDQVALAMQNASRN